MPIQTVTWDPTNKGGGVTLSNENLTAITPNTSNTIRASLGRATGKWYLEIKADAVAQIAIGIVNATAGVGNTINSVNSMYYLSYGGTKVHNTSNVAYGATYSTGDIISILLNLDDGTIEFWKNGISQGVAFTTVSTLGLVFPAVTGTSGSGGGTVTANFGASKFNYEIPKGYFSYDGSQYGGFNKILLSSNNKIYSLNNGLINLPSTASADEQRFIDFGMNLPIEFPILNKMTNIVDTATTLGSGKTFEHTVDLSKRRVDKIVLE